MSEALAGKRLYHREPHGFQWWWLIWIAAGICVFLCGTAVGVVTSGGDTWFGEMLSPPFGGADRVSILLVGTDNSGGKGLADTIMVAMLSPQTGDISAVSIPRDSRVEIPGVGFTRINASHAKGGMPLTKQTVESLLGFPIDYYVEVNVAGLVKLVDAIGGIDISVEKRMHYRDRSQNLSIDLSPGLQRLTGYQAMGYVRYRHDAVGDLGRMERQRQFMHAVAGKLLSPGYVTALPKVMQVFLDTVDTDLSFRDLLALKRVMDESGPDAIRSATLPAVPVKVGGASMLDLDPAQVRDTVERILLRQGITVTVLNATLQEGLANRVASELERYGCEIISVGNAERRSETTLVIDHRSRAKRAERVAEWLGRGAISVAPDGENPADVTVILGRDMLGGAVPSRS